MVRFFKGRLLAVRICLLISTLLLVLIGVATIYAEAYPADPSPISDTSDYVTCYEKQVVFACMGFLGFLGINAMGYRRLGQVSYWLYGLILVMLLYLVAGKFLLTRSGLSLPFAQHYNGAFRWIRIGYGGRYLPLIQPSEFCKLFYILALAWYLRFRSNYESIRALIGPFVLTLLPAALILVEPDLGTALLLMPILFVLLFVAGAKIRHLLLILMMGLMVSPVMWFKMRPYQRSRVASVLFQNEKFCDKVEQTPWLSNVLVGGTFDAGEWRNGDGYNLIRSKLAVASGGGTGRGFRRGPFIKYEKFLPEKENDFIIAAIAHQWGFLGCLGVIGLYGIIFLCGLIIARSNPDPFARLVVMGVLAMFFVQVLENISMSVGLMPITGLTLPLVSYGGSSLLVSFLSVGLLNNIGRCRPFSVANKLSSENDRDGWDDFRI
ncbi:MAG: FtsW/RodA/SpoVE family cell cycle protein [Planctomycetes bacterium]|nr:FtsW/RodA/SpoVE family cell cycle protein [Planctomycetota bacterium]